MPRILIIGLLVGLVSGFLVGGFHNLFTVPVMERAIILEEQRAMLENDAAGEEEEGGATVSLGVQRWGMALGTGIWGAIMGLLFAGGYTLLRRLFPSWQPLAIALVVGALGFWALSLFPFIRYPLNPPGVGEESSLTARQGYQALFMILSAVGIAALLFALGRANTWITSARQRLQIGIAGLAAYAVFALIIVFSIPGNPDPVPVPVDLLELFRTLTMAGQFLQWMLLALGAGLALVWYQKKAESNIGSRNLVPDVPRDR